MDRDAEDSGGEGRDRLGGVRGVKGVQREQSKKKMSAFPHISW